MRLINCQDGAELQLGQWYALGHGSDKAAVVSVGKGILTADVTVVSEIGGQQTTHVWPLPIRYWSPGSLFDPVIVVPD